MYLVDQMHAALSNFLSLEDKTPVPEPLAGSAQLKHFAREAEVNGDFELAAKYYKEVRTTIPCPIDLSSMPHLALPL